MESRINCYFCSKPNPEFSCKCGGIIKVFCVSCITQHLRDTSVVHMSIPIQVAYQSLSFQSNELPAQDTVYVSALITLETYKNNLVKFRADLQEVQDALIKTLYKLVNDASDEISAILNDVEQKYDVLTYHLSCPSDAGMELLRLYREGQLERMLGHRPKFLEIRSDNVIECLNDMIYIGDTPPVRIELREIIEESKKKIHTLEKGSKSIGKQTTKLKKEKSEQEKDLKYLKELIKELRNELNNHKIPALNPIKKEELEDQSSQSRENHYKEHLNKRYIYTASDLTKHLIEHDVYLNTSHQYDLSAIVKKQFWNTSTCLLNNGDIFIAGGNCPSRKDVFIYRINLQECIRCPPMKDARGDVTLFYFKYHVYAFGGFHCKPLKLAEKFDLEINKWISLTNMKEARHLCSCVGYDDKILIIGGVDSTTIEEFDVYTKKFKLIQLNQLIDRNISALYNNNIFIISKHKIFTLNKQFQVMDSSENTRSKRLYTLNNMLDYQDQFIFYNSFRSKIEVIKLI
jgi:hypothetical protein